VYGVGELASTRRLPNMMSLGESGSVADGDEAVDEQSICVCV
jgi:hypothetical protein